MTSRALAVLDIDGVLADVRHRLHFLDRTPKDWAGFFGHMRDDPPLPEGLALASELASSYDVVYLTGRPERTRDVTGAWLRTHDLPRGRLVMRRPDDRRPARVSKLGQLRRLAADAEVHLVVDDDPAVIAAMERAGFPVRLADWVPRPEQLDLLQERLGRS